VGADSGKGFNGMMIKVLDRKSHPKVSQKNPVSDDKIILFLFLTFSYGFQ
jgi:hypothetical protein